MDSETNELLKKNLELAEENNKMLRSMKRSIFISRILTLVYWVLIIGSALGVYYFIQPYINELYGVYGGVKTNLGGLNDVLYNLGQ